MDAEKGSDAISSMVARLAAEERQTVLRLVERLPGTTTDGTHAGRTRVVTGSTDCSAACTLLVSWLHRWCAMAADPTSISRRVAGRRSLIQLRETLMLAESLEPSVADEAQPGRLPDPTVEALGPYIQMSCELIAGRGAGAAEVQHWMDAIRGERATVTDLLTRLMHEAAEWAGTLDHLLRHIGDSCWIMGTDRHLTAAHWKASVDSPAEARPPAARKIHPNGFAVRGEPRPLVSAMLSLYGGGRFIRRFMDNITGQEGFGEYCELVIVDAASPDNEIEVIRPYLDAYPNIEYIRHERRISIYEAWNLAARAARGVYLTTTNADDLRRHDSLLLQAAVFEKLPHVDIVYQDFLYTLDASLPFERVERLGHVSDLPLVTPHSLLKFNSPHNAPMWRRALHDELGYFDTECVSAGDYDFWLRCLGAGKHFYKLNDPHVVYFHNPDGVSTRPGTRGVIESREISRRHARHLVPSDATVSDETFIARLGGSTAETEGDGVRRRYGFAQQALRDAARRHKWR